MCKLLLFIFPACFVQLVKTVAIDNEVVGTPTVICEPDKIHITANTRRPFLGRVFAKGMSKKEECIGQFTNTSTPGFEMEFKLAQCGMLRERKLSPVPGMMEAITVMVNFHYLFITKVDKAYSIQCFYGQQKFASISTNVNISTIPTTSLDIFQGSTSECSYEVRLHSVDGQMTQYARVGDKLFHIWKCVGPPDLKILVKDCSVYNNEEERFLIIDDRGCAIDPVIVNDLNYGPEGNMAFVESHAFKFADTSFLGFTCVIQLCSELNGDQCHDLTPPACSLADYQRAILRRLNARVADAPLPTNDESSKRWPRLRDEVDVSSPSLNILDASLEGNSNRRIVLESELEKLRRLGALRNGAFAGYAFSNEASHLANVNNQVPSPTPTENASDVCLSVFTFNTLAISAFSLILLMGTVSIVLFAKLLKTNKEWWRAWN